MELDTAIIAKVLKRLKAAVGYHELGLTEHALRCLDELAPLGKIGPFRLVEQVLRTEFLENQDDPHASTKSLEVAAWMLPAPARHAMEMTLAACYGQPDDASRAANIAASARGATLAGQQKPAGAE